MSGFPVCVENGVLIVRDGRDEWRFKTRDEFIAFLRACGLHHRYDAPQFEEPPK